MHVESKLRKPLITGGKTLKDVLEDFIKVGSKWGTTKTGGEKLASNTVNGFRKLERNS